MRMTNRYNRFVYRLWSPFYDAFLERFFHPGRRRAMEIAALQPGEKVCLVGIGTGTDLLLLPTHTQAIGFDISEAMLSRAREKLPLSDTHVELLIGDAQKLPLESSSVDVVILNLILSVVPDPQRCLSEALRVLRPGGRIVVFDKFLADAVSPSLGRKCANIFSKLFGTDINRRLGDMVPRFGCAIAQDEPSIMGGILS
jgi:phosphatidylethanolamine/phosphatidyl-N-methylethanolamine N-methyltransferase